MNETIKQSIPVKIFAALTLVGLLGGSLPVAAADEAMARDLTVEQQAVYGVQSTQETTPGALQVTAWVDHDDNTYAVGEQVQLTVRTNKDAYVTVMNVGASGATTVIFPNQYQTNNLVPANTPTVIPAPQSGAAITVNPPVGRELIKVIASSAPAAFFSSTGTTAVGAFKSVAGGARAAARDLQVTLDSVQAQNPGAQWDDYNKVIHTVTARPAGAAQVSLLVPSFPTFTNAATQATLKVATDKLVYRIGEPIQVAVTSDKSCHLTLVNYRTNGQVVVLFPNRVQPGNLLQAGQTLMLPGSGSGLSLQAGGPAGVENLLAICSTRNAPVFAGPYDFSQGFPLVGSAGTASRDLSVVLTEPAAQTAQALVGFFVVP